MNTYSFINVSVCYINLFITLFNVLYMNNNLEGEVSEGDFVVTWWNYDPRPEEHGKSHHDNFRGTLIRRKNWVDFLFLIRYEIGAAYAGSAEFVRYNSFFGKWFGSYGEFLNIGSECLLSLHGPKLKFWGGEFRGKYRITHTPKGF